MPRDALQIHVDAMENREAASLLGHGLPALDSGRLEALARQLGEWPLLYGWSTPAWPTWFEAAGSTPRRPSSRWARSFAKRVCAPSTPKTLELAERLWNLDDWEAEETCALFDDASMLLDLDLEGRTLRLHDVVRQYLIDQHDDLAAVHRRLLERCRPESGRWSDLDDGKRYLWRHLAGHLVGAGGSAELRSLLFDLDYLEAKLRTRWPCWTRRAWSRRLPTTRFASGIGFLGFDAFVALVGSLQRSTTRSASTSAPSTLGFRRRAFVTGLSRRSP